MSKKRRKGSRGSAGHKGPGGGPTNGAEAEAMTGGERWTEEVELGDGAIELRCQLYAYAHSLLARGLIETERMTAETKGGTVRKEVTREPPGRELAYVAAAIRSLGSGVIVRTKEIPMDVVIHFDGPEAEVGEADSVEAARLFGAPETESLPEPGGEPSS